MDSIHRSIRWAPLHLVERFNTEGYGFYPIIVDSIHRSIRRAPLHFVERDNAIRHGFYPEIVDSIHCSSRRAPLHFVERWQYQKVRILSTKLWILSTAPFVEHCSIRRAWKHRLWYEFIQQLWILSTTPFVEHKLTLRHPINCVTAWIGHCTSLKCLLSVDRIVSLNSLSFSF